MKVAAPMVILYVRDMARAVAFWRETFDLPVRLGLLRDPAGNAFELRQFVGPGDDLTAT